MGKRVPSCPRKNEVARLVLAPHTSLEKMRTMSAAGMLSMPQAQRQVLCCVTVCRRACFMAAPLFSRFLGEKSTP